MKTDILNIEGKPAGKINLPKCFLTKVREDIVAKILETKKTMQPYGASPIAGMKSSASGQLIHQRGVWKSQYKRGISRIPRKIMSRKGSQFNWVGAFSPNTVGGRRAHPPKPSSMINIKKINKKELKIGFFSALTASINSKFIAKKYKRIEEQDLRVPLIVESKLVSLKTKELIKSIREILGEKIFEVAVRKKKIRSGKGKIRGRKYKSGLGLLLVLGKDEKLKTNLFDIKNIENLGIEDLAKGGVGRLTIYTENAIKYLENIK